MVSTLKEKPSGGFYCSECRMSTSDLVEICPFCGSIISNWMDIIIQQENDRIRAPETNKDIEKIIHKLKGENDET